LWSSTVTVSLNFRVGRRAAGDPFAMDIFSMTVLHFLSTSLGDRDFAVIAVRARGNGRGDCRAGAEDGSWRRRGNYHGSRTGNPSLCHDTARAYRPPSRSPATGRRTFRPRDASPAAPSSTKSSRIPSRDGESCNASPFLKIQERPLGEVTCPRFSARGG
jgi:hypothetical protein